MKKFMKKKALTAKGKKFLALLLAVAMVVGGMPATTAYAEENNSDAVADTVAEAEAVAEVSEGNTVVAEEIVTAEDITGTDDGSEVGEPAEIVLSNLNALGNYTTMIVKEMNGNWSVTTQYSESSVNVFKSIVDSLQISNNTYVTVVTEEKANDTNLKSQLKYQWQQKGADGTYANMADGIAPTAAGEYKLIISIDKKFAVAEPVSVDFIIEKKPLYVTYDATIFSEVMDSGNTVKEIKETLLKAWGLAESAGGSMEAGKRYKIFVNEPVIAVKDTFSGAELADETVLKVGDDVSVWMSVTAKEEHQANYEIIQRDMINLRVINLVATRLEITNNRMENGMDLVRHYNGAAVASPSTDGEDAEITVKVFSEELDPETDEEIEIIPAEGALTYYWEDANGNVLSENPVDAGAYYYRAVYTDAEGIYASSSDRIRVVVEPATLVVKPVYSAESDVFAGSSASKVLQNVTYSLYQEGSAEEFKDYDKNTFWGVSYNNPAKTQSYAPVFKVQMKQDISVKPSNGEPKITQNGWMDVDTLEYPSGTVTEMQEIDKQVLTITTTTAYRVVFTGKKGLYSGVLASSQIDVNTPVNHADTNYVIDTTVMEEDANAALVEVKATANAVIDVTTMLKDSKGDSANNIYSKIYNGEALYKDRSEYKTAVVKSVADNSEIVSGTDSSLTYTWRNYTLRTVYDEVTGKTKVDEAGNPVLEAVIGNAIGSFNDYDYDYLPVNAGKYCLEVSYKDSTHQYTAEPAYVFFEIEKQLVKSVVSGEPVVYAGTRTRSFAYNYEGEMTHKLYLIPDNDLTLPVESLTELTELEAWNEANPLDPVYDLEWTVLVGDNIDPAVAKFEEADYYDTFDKNLLYKVGAKVNFNYVSEYSEYYYNFSNNYEVLEDSEFVTKYLYDTVDVTVKEMGDIQLEVRLDETKRGEYKKVYDGNGIDITTAIESGYVTVVKKDADIPVAIVGEGALDVDFIWRYEDRRYTWDSASGGKWELRNYGTYGMMSPAAAKEYELQISFAGDETYQGFEASLGTYTIEERDLVITPGVKETIVAGWYTGSEDFLQNVVDLSNSTITGYIEADATAFGSGILEDALGVVFDYDVAHAVRLDRTGQTYNGYLRTGTSYDIKVGVTYNYADKYADEEEWMHNAVIWSLYEDNYNIVEMETVFTPNTRGNSMVDDADGTYINAVYAANAVTVTPLTAVPYCTNLYTYEEGKQLPEGNYLQLWITAPKEFIADGYANSFNGFVFKNAVEKAGGYVMDLNRSNGMIKLAFPANDKKDKSFTVLWEEGYTEEYKIVLSKAELMVDARLAVAPKSLSFNGISKKMTVGETQQLDVKITRTLPGDVIRLNYQVVAGTDVMSVEKETGAVTALKPGTASVEVYPVRMNQNGEYERITSFKKKVVAKIKVTAVTAPKVSAAKTADTFVRLEYKVPADGYRREIYVLPGKGLKAAAFESKIAESGNSGFTGWTYIIDETDYENNKNSYENGNSNYYYNADKKVMNYKFTGLQPNTDYTVYVRNVSAIREHADGQKVAASASGSVKSFKTTRRQISYLDLALTEDSYQKVLWNDDTDMYEVALSTKALKLNTWLYYPHKDSQEAADNGDVLEVPYPISKAEQKTYLNPKMEYFVIDVPRSVEEISDKKNGAFKYYFEGMYFKASKLATMDKKGNLKLKGVGDVVVVARDTISGEYDAVELHIYSNVTKMTAKKLTLKTGSVADIYNYLVCYDGKSKLNGVYGLRDEHELVVSISDEQALEYKNGYLCALLPNKTVTVTIALESNPAVTTTMQVKTKAMDAVKSLKVYDVVDDKAMVSFTHTGNKFWYNYMYNAGFENEEQFKVTIKDNRGSIVASYVEQVGDDLTINWDKSNLVKKQFAYELQLDDYTLDRLSSYSVSIAPLYKDQLGKAVTKKFKTTNIPVSDYNLAKDEYGGVRIQTALLDKNYWWWYTEAVYFVSGNTYTVEAEILSEIIKKGATDTLTWKSSNKKVGTITANPGGYTATFKALKAGTTDIEIVSKVTKKVICRRTLVVIPVGDATQSYGILEPVNYEEQYAKNGVEHLTLGNPARFQKDLASDTHIYYKDYFFASFTAPFDGEFSFTKNVINGTVQFLDDYTYSGEKRTGFNPNGDTLSMKQGETIELTMIAYFNIYNYQCENVDFEVNVNAVKAYHKLPMNGSIHSTEGNYIRFVAPEDNYYTFCATAPDMSARVYRGTDESNSSYEYLVLYNEENSDYNKTNNGVGLKKGEVITLYLNNISVDYEVFVKGRSVTALSTTAVSTGDMKNGQEKWYSFTAPVTGNYTISSANATGMMKAEYYASLSDKNASAAFEQIKNESDGTDTNNFTRAFTLDAGEEVIICVYPEIAGAEGETEEQVAAKTASATISVSQPVVKSITLETSPQSISVPANGEAWVSFIIPEDETEYNFAYSSDVADSTVTASYYRDEVTNSYGAYNNKVNGLEKGDVLYIKLTTSATTAANVTVSVSKTTATELISGTAASLKVVNNGLYFYRFTAPSYGLYTFESNVTVDKEKGNHTLRARIYEGISSASSYESFGQAEDSDFYGEVELYAGEEIIFGVYPNNAFDGETTASVVINKVEPVAIDGTQVTLKPGERKWFKYTANSDDYYTFSWNTDTTASVVYGKELGTTGSIANGTSVSMLNGDTVYFKASNAYNADADTTLTLKAAPMRTMLPDGSFTLKASESQNYKYVVEKAGRYQVTYSVKEEDANISVFCNYSNITSGYEFVGAVGQTIPFTVTAGEKDATVTVTVKLIEPKTLTDEAFTVKPGEYQWFAFEVPATERYTVKVTDGEGNSLVSSLYYVRKMTDTYLYAGSNLDGDWLVKGNQYYFGLRNTSDKEISAKLLVKQLTPEILTAGEAQKSAELKAGEEKWFRFKAAETGIYTYDVEIPSGVSVAYFENASNSVHYMYGAMKVTMKKDTWYDFKISNSGSAEAVTAKIGVVKEAVQEWKEKTDLTVTAASGAVQYAEFLVPSTGYYAITAKEIPEGVTVSVTDSEGNNLSFSESKLYEYVLYEIGEKEVYNIRLNFSSDDAAATKTVKLAIEKIVPVELVSSVNLSVAKGMKTWATFTVPETARYTFSDNSTDAEIQYSLYKDNMSNSPEDGFLPKEAVLKKGEVYYLALYYNTAKAGKETPATAAFTLTVGEIEPKALSVGVFKDTLEAESVNWYSFTAPANNGYYDFHFEETEGTSDGADASDYVVEVYDTPIGAYESHSSTGEIMYMGETIYFRAVNNTTEKKDFRITVSADTVEAAPLNIGGVTQVSFTEAGTYWFKGTLSEGAYYWVSYVNEENTGVDSVAVWHGRNDYEAVPKNTPGVVYLSEGEVLFRVITQANRSTSITIKKVDTFVPDVDYTFTLDRDGYNFVQCKIDEFGQYRVSRKDITGVSDVYSYLYYRGDRYNSVNDGSNITDTYRFEGDYALIGIVGNKGDSTTLKMYTSTDYSLSYRGELSYDEPVTASLAAQEAALFTFTAPEYGYYEFEITDSSASQQYMYLYKENGTYYGMVLNGKKYEPVYSLPMQKGDVMSILVFEKNWNALDFTITATQLWN